MLVKDIRVRQRRLQSALVSPTSNGTLFFSANDGTTGFELWKSDGTAAGSELVRDILFVLFSPVGSNPSQLTGVNGTLFFVADDGVHGTEPFRSDGTLFGTVLAGDLRTGAPSSAVTSFVGAGGSVFFQADDGVNGAELWAMQANPVAVSALSARMRALCAGLVAALASRLLRSRRSHGRLAPAGPHGVRSAVAADA